MMTGSNDLWAQDGSGKSVRRVLIADDHDIVRRGLRSVVESRPGWEVVAEARDGREALNLAVSLKPHIAIVDYSIPMMNGAQVTRRICAESPKTQVLIFTMHESENILREVLTAGARGFLLKSDVDKLLYAALDALAHRKPFFTGQVSEALLALFLSQPTDTGELGLLTPREKEVIQLIAEGNSSRAVGTILNISSKTVEAHRASAMGKLQINSTAALVRYAIRNKMLEP
ncbi:response regulator [Phyllobacterium sp. 22552]|uniref:response regulator n=1 Tax=Phyllobacterium sp. 22552 TaxID=3453941 RepID=UPI003F861EA3